MAEHSSGFAVRDEALGAYVSAAGRIAADLAGFAHRELPTVRDLPAGAFGPLAHTTGFTEALTRFAHRAVENAHALGTTVRSIESGVDENRRRYEAADHLATRKDTHA
ncbi:MAG TPA: hypothetical protein VHV74_01575 [Pseudonocardiaceae bacterium]|jgi:hypothetical protein|nr:hypothetical protein [Pseudonocardiaceae bacterium]